MLYKIEMQSAFKPLLARNHRIISPAFASLPPAVNGEPLPSLAPMLAIRNVSRLLREEQLRLEDSARQHGLLPD